MAIGGNVISAYQRGVSLSQNSGNYLDTNTTQAKILPINVGEVNGGVFSCVLIINGPLVRQTVTCNWKFNLLLLVLLIIDVNKIYRHVMITRCRYINLLHHEEIR